jgi:predicted molibdopterin-dependent oxidoreductase YjgC
MQVTIDGIPVAVENGTTILEAARVAGSSIPVLCFDERQDPFGACRVCLVGVEGAPGPLPSCTTPCRDGMVVNTRDETARRVARGVVELVLSVRTLRARLRRGAGRLRAHGGRPWFLEQRRRGSRRGLPRVDLCFLRGLRG